jgi:hypothetical protein
MTRVVSPSRTALMCACSLWVVAILLICSCVATRVVDDPLVFRARIDMSKAHGYRRSLAPSVLRHLQGVAMSAVRDQTVCLVTQSENSLGVWRPGLMWIAQTKNHRPNMTPPFEWSARLIHLDACDGWPAYAHPGGTQMVKGVAVVPMELPKTDAMAECALLVVCCRSDEPRPLGCVALPGKKAGCAALASVEEGQFVAVVSGDSDDGAILTVLSLSLTPALRVRWMRTSRVVDILQGGDRSSWGSRDYRTMQVIVAVSVSEGSMQMVGLRNGSMMPPGFDAGSNEVVRLELSWHSENLELSELSVDSVSKSFTDAAVALGRNSFKGASGAYDIGRLGGTYLLSAGHTFADDHIMEIVAFSVPRNR